mmetsp:Transcript_36548/g.101432  ORF Transcript_36548/g.101432 Transcript_36548/m.101432 type:complete len:261 (-) Transcript_36548:216-998(-)
MFSPICLRICRNSAFCTRGCAAPIRCCIMFASCSVQRVNSGCPCKASSYLITACSTSSQRTESCCSTAMDTSNSAVVSHPLEVNERRTSCGSCKNSCRTFCISKTMNWWISTILSMVMPWARSGSPFPTGCNNFWAQAITSSSSSYCNKIRWKAFSVKPWSSSGSRGSLRSWIFLCPSTKERFFLFFFSLFSLASFRARTLTSCCTMPCTLTVSVRISRICCRVSCCPVHSREIAALSLVAFMSSFVDASLLSCIETSAS